MTLRKMMYFDEWRNPRTAKASIYAVGIPMASAGALAAMYHNGVGPNTAAVGVAVALFAFVGFLALFD
ncbi:MAG: hypothetical protein U5J64_12550 [Halobacteriales archaeon]|nr:hypothetical protein [Halobacteriales archaeon]